MTVRTEGLGRIDDDRFSSSVSLAVAVDGAVVRGDAGIMHEDTVTVRAKAVVANDGASGMAVTVTVLTERVEIALEEL